MGVRLTWLAAALREAGLPVREISGWQSRGHGDLAEVRGVIAHHTAGPARGNYPSERVVVHGRPGLSGPLANLGLARDGTWLVIAAGQAWHAGRGSISWCPAGQGNAHTIGIEAESTGTTAPNGDWTPQQREGYPRGVAALLRHERLPASRLIGHKEWTTRKIDPAFWDMDDFRREVERHLVWTEPARPALPTPREDDCMLIKTQPDKAKPVYLAALLSGPMFIGLGPTETPSDEQAKQMGLAVLWVEYGTWQDLDRRSHNLCDNPRPVQTTSPSAAAQGVSVGKPASSGAAPNSASPSP